MDQGFNFNIYNVQEVSRVEFIRKTYAHVAYAVLAFVGFEYLLLHSEIGLRIGMGIVDNMLLLLLVFFGGTWMANKWAAEPGNKQKQYLGLFIYSLIYAILFLPLFLVLFTKFPDFEATSILMQSSIMSAGLFTGLSAVALFSKKDFSFLRSVVTIGASIAFAAIIAGWLFGFHLGLWFSVGMVVLASASILYQTTQIIHEYHTSQYVLAALGLFASLMTLFFYILRIFMSRD